MSWPVLRGQIVLAKLPEIDTPKYFVVVSNNRRNRALPTVLAVRVTTTPPKRPLPSIVELPHGEALVGHVLCDSIGEIWDDEIIDIKGALSPRSLADVDAGLRSALDLR